MIKLTRLLRNYLGGRINYEGFNLCGQFLSLKRALRDIIACFKELVAKNKLENEVELNAAFCLGHCMDGVTIKVDNELVTGVNPQNAEQVFEAQILGRLKA